MKLSIVIPAYNEEKTIRQIIQNVRAVDLPGIEKEIIVVDDKSRDSTREILKTLLGIKPIFHDKNKGKGGAVKTGIENSTGDIILIQDADLEYNPEDFSILLQPILKNEVDFVMGSRFLFSEPKFFTSDGQPFFSHYIGNKVITAFTNLLYGQRKTDYEGCYKAFTRKIANEIKVETNGFAFDNELMCKTFRLGYEIAEVPIRYESRLYSEGKKITWKDGMAILWTILKWRFLPVKPHNASS